jgi:hypothetical protein
MATKTPKSRRWARATHKWVGLLGLVLFALMAISGIGLNHPDLIAGIDLPRSILPGDYEYRNWNRASLRGVVHLPLDGEGASSGAPGFVFGEAGVWDLRQGAAPVDFNAGLPDSYYKRDVRALHFFEDADLLMAGTRGGLYVRRLTPAEERWRRVELPATEGETPSVVELVAIPNGVLALTRSNLYRAGATLPLEFEEIALTRTDEEEREESLFRLIFEVHGGGAWGVPGRLAVDRVVGMIVFFSVTGGWFWWRRRSKTLAKGSTGRLVRKGLKLHIKLGVWFCLPIMVVALTGALERPPLLILIAGVKYPATFSVAPHAPNPWHDKLRKALYDPLRETLVFTTADGYYTVGLASLASGRAALRPMRGGPPVSVMGATLFQRLEGDAIVVGSMSGLFKWDRTERRMVDLYTGKAVGGGQAMGRPVGDRKVMGCYSLTEPLLCADYDAGLTDRRWLERGPPMPAELGEGGRISLWHLLFEFHNGRLFTFLLGWWAWLVVPVCGLSLALEAFSGVWPRLWPRKKSSEGEQTG